MIIIDYRGRMTSTESEAELREFATKLGLKPRNYVKRRSTSHGAHYDVESRRKYHQAIAAGAKKVSPGAYVEQAWWSLKKKILDETIDETIDATPAEDSEAETPSAVENADELEQTIETPPKKRGRRKADEIQESGEQV